MSSELFSFNYWVGFHSHIALFPSHPPPSIQPTITPQLFAPAEKKAKKNKKGAAAKGQSQKDGNAAADGAEMVAMNPQGEERKPELEVPLLMRSVGRSVDVPLSHCPSIGVWCWWITMRLSVSLATRR